jgi:ribosomal protein L11 methyltransferase
MTGPYVEVEITAGQVLAENLIAILSQLGFEGFWEADGILRCYISMNRWSPAFLEEVNSVVSLVARSSDSAAPRIRVQTIEERNWNEEWERTIQPIRITDRIVIAPSWNPVHPKTGDIVLTIDPKMSFGTGYHETTRLMLALLDQVVRPGARLLDVGTGTGVLAIAGIKLGCSRAVGCDTDEWSFENARENAAKNGVTEKVKIIRGSVSDCPPGHFEIVAANIQLTVIMPILHELKSRMTPEGVLLLSGLLLQDEEDITRTLLKHNLSPQKHLIENEWLALTATS